jgi:hypothetical protein
VFEHGLSGRVTGEVAADSASAAQGGFMPLGVLDTTDYGIGRTAAQFTVMTHRGRQPVARPMLPDPEQVLADAATYRRWATTTANQPPP